MEKNFEKSIKRFLKRKKRITFGFIIAFLLSCNFTMAADVAQTGILIGQDEKTGEIVAEDTNYPDNTFKEGVYTNNSIIKETSLEIGGITGNFGIFTYYVVSSNNPIPLSIVNNGIINIQSTEDGVGIYNYIEWDWNDESNEYKTKINDIINNSIILANGKNGYGIYNFSNSNSVKMTFSSIINNGIIFGEGEEDGIGIKNLGASYNKEQYVSIPEISNYGIIFGKGGKGEGIGISNIFGVSITDIYNFGIIMGEGLNRASGIDLSGTDEITSQLKNNGLIIGRGEGVHTTGSGDRLKTSGIDNDSFIKSILNNGVISGTTQAYSEKSVYAPYGIGIYNLTSSSVINEIDNNGIILGQGNNRNSNESHKGLGYGIYNGITTNSSDKALISDLSNKGIIYGEKNAVLNKKDDSQGSEITKFNNYGLLINKTENVKVVEGTDVTNYGLMFTVKNDGTYEIDKNNSVTKNPNVINAELKDDNKGTESLFTSDEKDYNNKYINGITDTLKVDKSIEITNSVINGYTNAVVL